MRDVNKKFYSQVETAEPLKDISEEDGEKDEQCSCMGLDARSDTCSITLERSAKFKVFAEWFLYAPLERFIYIF